MKTKNIIVFILFLILCGTIGYFFGYYSVGEGLNIASISENIEKISSVLFYGILLLVIYQIYLLLKVNSDMKIFNDDEAYTRLNKNLSSTITVSDIIGILTFMLFGLSVNFEKTIGVGIFSSKFQLIFYLFYLFFALFTQVYSVLCYKKIAPEKKGDPLSFSFNKDWFESCDEAEKIKIGQASYESFKVTRLVGFCLLIVSMVLRILNKIDLYSTLFIGLILIVQFIVYVLNASKDGY